MEGKRKLSSGTKLPRFCRPISVLTLFLFTGFVLTGPWAYAAPPEGKGNAGGNGNGSGNAGSPPGQEKRAENASDRGSSGGSGAGGSSDRVSDRAASASSGDRGRSDEAKLERLHPHQERKAQDLPDWASDTAKEKSQTRLVHAVHAGRDADHGIRGREAAKAHMDSLLKSLNKLEHARWDYNPHDTRGQGNMGKVDMRSPYGFDKDSGREGAERGRPIHPEPEVLDLTSLLTIDWQMTDYYALGWQQYLDYILRYYPWDSFSISWAQQKIDYLNSLSYVSIATNTTQGVNYTLSFGEVPTSFEGTTLLVTTTLTSLNDYKYSYWTYNANTGWVYTLVDYDAGEVVVQQTQEVALTDEGTFTFSYDPPTTIANYIGNYFELAVTVTEPVSGATYTIEYDKQVYLFRCPYGIVYDKTTGKAIAGVKVTIHNADGSIVALDKAANPNASNPQTTDATGRYNAKLAVGNKYYLTVKARGYEEYRSPLFSERWHVVREDVGLTPSAGTATPSVSATPLVRPEGKGQEVHSGVGVGAPLPSK